MPSPPAAARLSSENQVPEAKTVMLEPSALDELVQVLRGRGHRVVGPTVRDGAIVLDELESAAELPIGVGDVQAPGSYRLRERGDESRFGYAASPHSPKQFLFPASTRLFGARRDGADVEFEEPAAPDRPLALFVRPCELHGIAVQDRVFLHGKWVDRDYDLRRQGAFVVVVECGTPAGTCFCTSTGTGPTADGPYDLALTEILSGEHRFLARAGSDAGAEVLDALTSREATDSDLEDAVQVTRTAAEAIGRRLDTDDLRGLLERSRESARWHDVAARCLSCTNCTLVCPTCFCSSAEDVTSLDGTESERVRRWDSCFSIDHSYIHGGAVRPSSPARYRQWLTHKFGTWIDQFGTSGCVGCGRCIAWCPVGIDVTEELAALRAEEEASHANH